MEATSLFDAMRADGVPDRDVDRLEVMWSSQLEARGVTVDTLTAYACAPAQLAAILMYPVPLHAVLALLDSRLASPIDVAALCGWDVPLYDALMLLEQGVPLDMLMVVAQSSRRALDYPLLALWHEFGFTADEVVECVGFGVPLDLDDIGELGAALALASPRVRVAAAVLLHGGMDAHGAVLVARQCDKRPWRQTLLTFVSDGMTSRDALAAARALDAPRRTAPRTAASRSVVG